MYLGSSVSSTERDINMRLAKAWTATDRLSIIWKSDPFRAALTALLFTNSWREDSWMHTFPKGISTIENANSLLQGLNLGHCVHFLRRWPLYNEYLQVKWRFCGVVFSVVWGCRNKNGSAYYFFYQMSSFKYPLSITFPAEFLREW